MPQKAKNKKAGKGKPLAMVDALSTEEMSKDQLEEHIIRLREELDREREERSFFQLERDKIQDFWEISKRNLQEAKAELRNRSIERDEAEERHRVEITVYKQKLKHVLSEQHNTVTELKMNGLASTWQLQNQHTQAELAARRDLQGMQAELREKKLHQEQSIKELQLKHQMELMELNNDYDCRIREIEVKHHHKMQAVMETEDKKRRSQISELEDQMKCRVAALIQDQDRALREAAEYFSLQSRLQAENKLLQEELAEVQKKQERLQRLLSEAQMKNQNLTKDLQEAQEELSKLQKLQQEQSRDKTIGARVKLVEKELMELRNLRVEHEVLLQAFEKQERDELLKRQTKALLDVQQRRSLKEQLLERKLAALTNTQEKEAAQLCTALSASNVDPVAGGRAASQLQDILDSKPAAIRALQQELAQDCQEYDAVLLTCRDRMEAVGLSPHDLPFRPAQQGLNAPPTDLHQNHAIFAASLLTD
ncbi:dynein regulatory complex subunit 4 isoform X2 [Parambassis ranga]|uniref:Dynein regulatory complex subunit 4 n=1 Tax=Parambassis ranga TaxID=210632 RepID=A0A6P7IEI3_9TELE|nr:dynein regulatory complex subunit 4-like isoform X2 [Parambassis ranga]